MTDVQFRHNIMHVDSMDTFFSIRGGYRNQTRDVYFVRALGESEAINELITARDRKAEAAANAGRGAYVRLGKLPALSDPGDITCYSQLYDAIISGKGGRFRNISADALFGSWVKTALGKIMALYRESRAGVSPSMERNLGTKFLFWLDTVLCEVLVSWTPRAVIKVAADNITKEQEYLFYLMLTFLGCDVLLYETRADACLSEKLLSYSVTVKLGSFGKTQITPYQKFSGQMQTQPVSDAQVRQKPESAAPAGTQASESVSAQSRNDAAARAQAYAGNQAVAPNLQQGGARYENRSTPAYHAGVRRGAADRNRQGGAVSRNGAAQINTPATQASAPAAKKTAVGIQNPSFSTAARPANSIPASHARMEKSYEELARLAAFVVQIGVHKPNGELVATGSGIMIGSGGYILTNFHVASAGSAYSVRIEEDDTVYRTSEVVKYNPDTDLAIIRISRQLTPIPIYAGPAPLVRGQKVIAIGSPLGLFNSVSDGIISGFRTIRDVDMIQFTAPISHGSSGGAVLNMYGEIIGISTAGIDSGQNLNLAVGYETIRLFTRGFTG